MPEKETNSPKRKECEVSDGATSDYVSEDPIILEAFTDIKAAILARRTDIVRQILSAAQALREDDEFDSDGEEQDKKELGHKYDKGEYFDLLSLLLLHKDTDSGTLLHYATRIGSIDIVRALLASGANCTVKNTENLNPYQYCDSDQMRNVYIGELMQTVSQSRIFRVEQLLTAGIDINSCDGGSSNNSVLHWAVSFSDLTTVKLVLEKGAKINAKNGNGEVPLHDAIKRGNKSIVDELVLHGANCHIVPIKGSCEGKSPLVLAQDKPELLELLIKQSEFVENDEHPTSPIHTTADSSASITSQNVPTTKVEPKLITPTQLDPMFQYLCPKPKMMQQFNGLFFVPPTELTVQLVGKGDEILHLKSTVDLFSSKLQEIGTNITYQYSSCACMPAPSNIYLQCIINKRSFSQSQEYKLQFTTNKILLVASSTQSLYHGLSTFLQTLKLFKGKSVPLVQITDWPSHSVRSLIFDFKKNDAPNLDMLCEIADLLSLFKVNQIQLNVDHVIRKKEGKAFYTANEFLEFQWFCKQRFIEVVPFIDLTSSSAQFFRNYPDNQTEINDEELNRSLDSFVFSKSVHVKLPEGIACYQKLLKYCSNRDIILQISSPALPDLQLNQVLNFLEPFVHNVFCSNKFELESRSTYTRSLGLNYNVCFQDSLLDRICPDHVGILTKVHEIITTLPTHRCHGISLIHHGNEVNQLGNFSLALPSLVIASSIGWGAPDVMNEEYVRSVTNYLIYEDDHDIIGSRILGLGRWSPLATVSHHLDTMEVSVIDDVIQKCSTNSVTITIDQIQEFCKQIKLLKSEMEKMKLHIRCRRFVYEELAFLAEILFFLSRLCYSVLNDKNTSLNDKNTSLNDKNTNLSLELKSLSQVHKSDYSNKLMVLMKQNEAFLQKYYKNASPASYTTMKIFENILKNILPNNATSSNVNSGLKGIFTV